MAKKNVAAENLYSDYQRFDIGGEEFLSTLKVYKVFGDRLGCGLSIIKVDVICVGRDGYDDTFEVIFGGSNQDSEAIKFSVLNQFAIMANAADHVANVFACSIDRCRERIHDADILFRGIQ